MVKVNKKMMDILFLAVMFCFAISLFNYAGYIFSIVVGAMLLLYIKQIEVSAIDILLVLFSVGYGLVFTYHYGVSVDNLILQFVGPWTSYMLGKLYIKKARQKHAFLLFLIVLAMGFFLHGLLNVVAYIRSDYFALYQHYRQTVDFWRGELVNVKTTEMLYTFATGIALGVIFCNKAAIRYRVLSTIIVVFSLAVTVFLANRTLIVIFTAIFLWRGIRWFSSKKVSGRAKGIAVIAILMTFLVLLLLSIFNVAGFNTFLNSLKLVQRFLDGSELTRFDVWANFFEDFRFFDHLWGGKQLMEGTDFGYLHNFWMDIYNVAGVVPFLTITILTGVMIYRFFQFRRVMLSYGHGDEYTIFQSLMFAVVLNFMVEPIIEANPYYFLTVLMYLGAMEGRKKQVMAQTDCN